MRWNQKGGGLTGLCKKKKKAEGEGTGPYVNEFLWQQIARKPELARKSNFEKKFGGGKFMQRA